MEIDGLRVGLCATAFAFGLRHGVDWDHIAAIADVTSMQSRPRRAMFIATMYAAGHGAVVLALGTLAILTGQSLPAGLNALMGRIVGATLVILAASVLVSLARNKRNFRMQSRWMLIGRAVSRATGWARSRMVTIEHDHPHGLEHGHVHVETQPAPVDGSPSGTVTTAVTTEHRHGHRHIAPMPEDVGAVQPRSAALLGAVHGIGAETPTQVVLFLTAARVSGTPGALLLLVLFVGGIFVANSLLAAGASYGVLNAQRSFAAYAVLAIVNAGFSAIVGTVLLTGGSLPTILGG